MRKYLTYLGLKVMHTSKHAHHSAICSSRSEAEPEGILPASMIAHVSKWRTTDLTGAACKSHAKSEYVVYESICETLVNVLDKIIPSSARLEPLKLYKCASGKNDLVEFVCQAPMWTK